MLKSFPFYRQLNAMDCGPTCLRMIAKFYGKHYSTNMIRNISGFGKEGVSLLGIAEAAEQIGFRTRGVQVTCEQLIQDANLPAILYWGQNHFVVALHLSRKSLFKRRGIIWIADPAKDLRRYNKLELLEQWANHRNDIGDPVGIALLLEPTAKFYENEGDIETTLNWSTILQYLRNSKWQVSQVFFALLITSLLQLVAPFLTQSIVDTGITTQNLQFITIVLLAQLMLIFSRTVVDFIRSHLLLQISTIINLSILSDFWIKLTKLPISYFDCHHTGDTLQRIGDTKNIERFLTGPALNILFSFFNFLIFAAVLLLYNPKIFFVFALGSLIYFTWVKLFLGIRRKLNYQNFYLSAKENDATLQLVQGMQEIKLNGAEQLKRWEWENLQTGIFKLSFKNLSYSQIQQAGAVLINQGKDVIIIFLVAQLVVKGQLTLGAMLAIQYIIGQLSNPIEQFVGFIQNSQDAKISLERLNELHSIADENTNEKSYLQNLPINTSINLENLSFTYPEAGNEPVLKSITMQIPQGKTTAIVGTSGSGKTTLIKLLLQFYNKYEGEIYVGETRLNYFGSAFWRKQCGVVLQDGYIFNDTIAKNIAIGFEQPEYEQLLAATEIANILSFVESLPNGFNTKIGANGIGISQGQKQRLLIARAIYKNPHYLFFDEATNALDANNEKAITENLRQYFKGRTVLVVAHRLSTVKNADNIVVLKNGKIIEQGTHTSLTAMKGFYYELVKNQLDLSN